jgi:tetratricopeptide (TPR) repeat protein
MAGQFDDSARYATEALRLRPGFQGAQRQRAAALGAAGQVEEARAALEHARRNHPELSIAWIRKNVPYQTTALMEHYLSGMRKAGLE